MGEDEEVKHNQLTGLEIDLDFSLYNAGVK
jgi:hypothetical protein